MTRVFTPEENQKWSNTLTGKMTSACLVLRSGMKVLMVKAGYKDHWTFPSGIVDPGESPKAAALRETQEEVGLTVDDNNCKLLTVIYTASNGSDRERFNFAFITDTFDEGAVLSVPNNEIEQAEWVDFGMIAERSGNKGSYVNFQRILLDPSATAPYIEAYPTRSPATK